MKRLVIGILAHVDSGKTTLSEAMLYQAGALRKLGRVDHRDAFLDTDALERARGITIFAKQAVLSLPEAQLTLLDTPGHVDFSAEAERALQVMDYAVLVVSSTDGVQSHTETLWRLLERYQVPVFLFLNKMDLAGRTRTAAWRSCADASATGAWTCRTRTVGRSWPCAARSCWRLSWRAAPPPGSSWPGPSPGGSCSPAFSFGPEAGGGRPPAGGPAGPDPPPAPAGGVWG